MVIENYNKFREPYNPRDIQHLGMQYLNPFCFLLKRFAIKFRENHANRLNHIALICKTKIIIK